MYSTRAFSVIDYKRARGVRTRVVNAAILVEYAFNIFLEPAAVLYAAREVSGPSKVPETLNLPAAACS